MSTHQKEEKEFLVKSLTLKEIINAFDCIDDNKMNSTGLYRLLVNETKIL